VSLRELSLDDIEALAVGAWVLGTGGGGNPYLPLLNMRQLYRDGHRVQLIDASDLADDDWVGTVANMGAELGATCSLFPYHKAMGDYLRATRRADVADLADQYAGYLRPDPEIEKDPDVVLKAPNNTRTSRVDEVTAAVLALGDGTRLNALFPLQSGLPPAVKELSRAKKQVPKRSTGVPSNAVVTSPAAVAKAVLAAL
jgi:hypothetical protein